MLSIMTNKGISSTYSFRAQVLIGDELTLLDVLGKQRTGAADGDKVNAAVLLHSIHYLGQPGIRGHHGGSVGIHQCY